MKSSRAVILLSLSSSLISAQRTCKCLPGQSCFPTTTEWTDFGSRLSTSETLIVGQRPMGAVCYQSDPLYNAEACRALNSSLSGFNWAFLSSQIDATNYLNYDSVISPTGLVGCPYFPLTNNATCAQGRVPPYAVNVSSIQDIVDSVKFASENNLRLVVKNTGHEVIGRTFGVGALELFTHNLKNLTIHESFVPSGAPEGTEAVPAMTMGAGVDWNQAYNAAQAANQTVVGGLSPVGTVGAAAGWQLGTGHSVISPFYGLGVDNSLEFTVVLPNASVVTVNEYLTPDLFWAIRGGGGPSFGIVVNTTVRTHSSTPYTGAFFVGSCDSDESYINLLATWMKYHNNVSDAGWGGVWPFAQQTLSLTFAAQGTPPTRTEALSTMDAFFAEARNITGVTVAVATYHNYSSFGEFTNQNLVDPKNSIGFNFTTVVPGEVQGVTSSWLLPRELTAAENAEMLARIMANVTAVGTPFFVGGGIVADLSKNTSSAANPAWRNTITDMTILGGGNATMNTNLLREIVHLDIQPFRTLAPPPMSGMYLNEVDYLEEDWQIAQWGVQYPRLLTIKKEIDPEDLLIVYKGVNSEEWDDEIICKTTNQTSGSSPSQGQTYANTCSK
ncbi:FAD-binding domain-containing protein [Dendrothele bispora CBS 962.96]|uniref:FAD-binding domain-containing protein n=1 Tax=Dendrothele bispora (strain CBS 962.96) TaxID=1314807 RepID=A0A4S8LD89_DENBC|nr:FAD-binding domain-containing protein [Dendrothele bispora CBS 962.96]